MENTQNTPKPAYRVRLVRNILSPVFIRQHRRHAAMLHMPLVTLEDGIALQGVLIGRGVRVTTAAFGHSERKYYAATEAEARDLAARTATSEESIYIGTLRGSLYREVQA